MKWLRWLLLRCVLPGLATGLLTLLVVRYEAIRLWLTYHTGSRNTSGSPPNYNFWSGFGSDLGEYVIVWGIFHGVYINWKHLNCNEPWCLRVKRHQSAGGQYGYCTRHQPGHEEHGGKMPPREHRLRLHWEHAAGTTRSGEP